MQDKFSLEFEHLGQSGVLITSNKIKILVDPYLSNSVQELDSSDLERKVVSRYQPNEMKNIDWILITHDHLDHCDPHTLPLLAQNNPQSKFIGPKTVRKILLKWNILPERILYPPSNPLHLGSGISVRATPAAHPELKYDDEGLPVAVGWLFEYQSSKIYMAGDTSVCQELIDSLEKFKPIDVAVLPVNEDNFYRRRRGIIGNMSIREAFQLALDIEAKSLVPVHWDLFEANSASPDEIQAVYKSSDHWSFDLCMHIDEISI